MEWLGQNRLETNSIAGENFALGTRDTPSISTF